ncbi:MAG TPA: cytochrome c biogenesis protein CcdA [Phycisphaerales bacterium]|nr:cytochrome c biogenesis protein CcdA [Phycisphaerales bacterium]HMP36993.1 cytochrome c biogenesis protein CcdA [Phycisphaerales bacterium]
MLPFTSPSRRHGDLAPPQATAEVARTASRVAIVRRALVALVVLCAGLVISPATAQQAGEGGRPGGGLPGFSVPGLGGGIGDPAGRRIQPSTGASTDVVEVIARPAAPRVAAGGDLPVAVIFDIADGWHIWTDDRPFVGDMRRFARFSTAAYTAVEVAGSPPSGVAAHPGFIQWPEVHAIEANLGDGAADYAVFEGRAVAFLPVTIEADAPLGPTTLRLTVSFQACDYSQCLRPVTIEVPVSIEVVALADLGDTGAVPADFAAFVPGVFADIRAGRSAPSLVAFDVFGLRFALDGASQAGFLLLLLVAAAGGMLLNFTPCVLPVIPIKIMGLNAAAGNPARRIALGVAMTLGVIAFWIGLGVAIASVTQFKSINQLFQIPLFTIGVGAVIGLLALGLMGLFEFRLPQFIYRVNPGHDTLVGSFGFGIMTAVLSTPCTAPLMGSAAAWAATQPGSTTLAVFTAIGAGMALPYLVLTAFPGLVRRMPKTGPASDLIKQVMAGLLLAAAAYFVGAGLSGILVDPPSPPSRAYWWVVAGFGFASGAWLLIRTFQISPSLRNRAVFGGLGLAMAALSAFIGLSQTAKGPIDWVYYTPDRFAAAREAGNVVVMDFTAEWCLNCKALETGVLYPKAVSSQLRPELGVVPIKVDITGNNPLGNDMLRAAGRITIPLLVVYAADGTEVFKSDAYTQQQVLDAIAEAKALGGGRRELSGDRSREPAGL